MVLSRNSKILVNVDEALQDLLVVSYASDSKIFQGVLLDSTNKFLPCRIPPTTLSSPTKTESTEEDKLLYSIRQRFTYFQEKPAHLTRFNLPNKNSKLNGKLNKNQKMTVRLRPRQVLCSKCKSICNENSENVNYSTRSSSNSNKKTNEPPDKSPRSLLSENRRENQTATTSPPKLRTTLIPRLSRLHPTEISNATRERPVLSPNAQRPEEEFWMKASDIKEEECGEDIRSDNEESDDRQMVLRKKRSVGSMEDLWDETVFEEGSKKAKTTPVIKISFGSQGEGTVLKIPSKVQTCSESEAEDEDKQKPVTSTKAAKRAMKKAKKEAKKKILIADDETSPESQSSMPEYKKHKHKVKHKKKHKAERADDEAKEKCVKQKLSINLKRLNSNTYEKAEENSVSADSTPSEEVPDFPAACPEVDKPTVSSANTNDGSTVAVGDVVWGKIHGFPWWPGKVLSITIRSEGNSWDAHVSWYGSSTSSLMPCDQLSPFLQTFKVRYNKRKKSAGYREAIRQATSEASASDLVLAQSLLEEADIAVA